MGAIRDVFHAFLVEGATFEGEYEFARIWGTDAVPQSLIPFDIAIKSEKHLDSWIHFYRHDYKFECLWRDPQAYLPILKKFPGVISPDFSKYRNMPLWQQIEAQGKTQALGYWLEKNGIPVIPNVRWGDERTYDFCFDGISKYKTVAIGSLGCFKNRIEREYFRLGLAAMLDRLCPERILVYGRAPEKIFAPIRADGIEVISHCCYYESSRTKESTKTGTPHFIDSEVIKN